MRAKMACYHVPALESRVPRTRCPAVPSPPPLACAAYPTSPNFRAPHSQKRVRVLEMYSPPTDLASALASSGAHALRVVARRDSGPWRASHLAFAFVRVLCCSKMVLRYVHASIRALKAGIQPELGEIVDRVSSDREARVRDELSSVPSRVLVQSSIRSDVCRHT